MGEILEALFREYEILVFQEIRRVQVIDSDRLDALKVPDREIERPVIRKHGEQGIQCPHILHYLQSILRLRLVELRILDDLHLIVPCLIRQESEQGKPPLFPVHADFEIPRIPRSESNSSSFADR